MEHTTRQVPSSDVRLHVEQWLPEGPPKFAVCISHGAAEHISRYARVAGWFAERGGMTFGADHRGQGKSGGPAGHVESFHVYADDLGSVVRSQTELAPAEARPDKIPWFLFGHSMGGLIVLDVALRTPDGLGAVTPFGGGAFLAGWGCLAWAALRAGPRRSA